MIFLSRPVASTSSLIFTFMMDPAEPKIKNNKREDTIKYEMVKQDTKNGIENFRQMLALYESKINESNSTLLPIINAMEQLNAFIKSLLAESIRLKNEYSEEQILCNKYKQALNQFENDWNCM